MGTLGCFFEVQGLVGHGARARELGEDESEGKV